MDSPSVSVVIPVFNAMPWLTECVDSLRAQTIDAGRLEVIAVDDGSTDGGRGELDRLAAAYPALTVHTMPGNSGGPGAPRNAGLDRAAGDYVFFLDADDYLGPEALRRLVAAAEKNGADIVLGRMAAAPGFGTRAPRSMFARSQARADLYTSKVYWTLSPLKLFRRSLLNRTGARFAEGRPTCEDQRFVARAYLDARVISVLADYDYYYVRTRPEGGHATGRAKSLDQRLWRIAEFGAIAGDIAERVPPGRDRDHLVTRHVGLDLLPMFGPRWLDKAGLHEQRATRDAVRAYLDRWMTPGVRENLPPHQRLLAHLVRVGNLTELTELTRGLVHGPPRRALVEDKRVYLGLPFFRDPAVGAPDDLYDGTDGLKLARELTGVELDGSRLRLTGTAHIPYVDTDEQETTLILRRRGTRDEHRRPVEVVATPALSAERDDGLYDYSRAGFAVTADFADLGATAGGSRSPTPVGDGVWDVWVEVTAHGVTRERRLGRVRSREVDTTPSTSVIDRPGDGPATVTTYYTDPFGNLSLEVGGGPRTASAGPRLGLLRSRRSSLLIETEPVGTGMDHEVVLRRRHHSVTMPTIEDGAVIRARMRWPVLRLRPGRWTVWLRASTPDGHRDLPVRTDDGSAAAVRVLPRLMRKAKRLRGR